MRVCSLLVSPEWHGILDSVVGVSDSGYLLLVSRYMRHTGSTLPWANNVHNERMQKPEPPVYSRVPYMIVLV